MPVMCALVIPGGQPSTGAEVCFLHGSLHATKRGTRCALADAGAAMLSGTRI
jgi:hypothetical protein